MYRLYFSLFLSKPRFPVPVTDVCTCTHILYSTFMSLRHARLFTFVPSDPKLLCLVDCACTSLYSLCFKHPVSSLVAFNVCASSTVLYLFLLQLFCCGTENKIMINFPIPKICIYTYSVHTVIGTWAVEICEQRSGFFLWLRFFIYLKRRVMERDKEKIMISTTESPRTWP